MSLRKTPGPGSSSKRTAQNALSRAVTAARRPRLEEPPKLTARRASAEAKLLAAGIERSIAAGRLDLLSADALQALIAAACRLYSARRQDGEEFAAVPKTSVTATDVMVTASALLRAADLAAFELGVWQGFTGR